MLQVYIYGTTEQGFLDLPADAKLSIEGQADSFDENLSIGEFSLPVEIPWTDNNRRLLNFSERLENNASAITYWRVDVLDDDWPELVNGKLSILEKIGKFSYKRGKFNISISATKGLFGSLIYNKKMSSLKLGGTINWPTIESRAFATDVMKSLYSQYPYLAFAPVAIENYFDKNRPDYLQEFLVKDTVNNIIITGAGADDWQFARPIPATPSIPTSIGQTQHADFRTVPFFQLKWLLKKVFEEFGYTIVGDLIDDTDFDDVYLFNNYSLEAYQQYQDFNRNINPANHVPNTANSTYMLISDFIKNTLSFFNAYLVFDGANNLVQVRYRYKNITQKNSLNITDAVIDDFDSTIDVNSQNKGFKLAFGWDANDGYHSDRVKEIAVKENNETWVGEKLLIATVATFANLVTLSITGVTLTTSYCVFVQADNMYYSVADATSTPKKWDAYAEGLQDYEQRNAKKEDPGRTITLGMAPMAHYVQLNATTGLYEKQPFIGTRGTGSYATNKGVRVNTPFGLSVFYIKKQVINGNNIPTSFTHNRDAANNTIEKYSLSLQGNDGIGKALHTRWQALQEKAEIVKTSITVSKALWQQLQAATQVEIDGVVYLLKKNERTIPQLEPMVVYLLPL